MTSPKPVLIWDGECGFCRIWIRRWALLTGDRVEYRTSQEVGDRYAGASKKDYESAVYLAEPDGKMRRGARAVFGALAYGGYPWGLWACEKIPGFAPLADAAYAVVARNRVFFSRMTRLLVGDRADPPTDQLTRWLYLRALGLVYLIAFASLWTQVSGLAGSQGILPSVDSDTTLQLLCGAGTAGAALFMAGFAPLPLAILLWALYWRLSEVCGIFLWFQWDALLLEMGALAVFFVPWRQWLPRGPRASLTGEPVPKAILWLHRWLLFRVMFLSGYVKLASGDPNWRNLSALNYHFETQPLPTVPAWYLHQLSPSVHRAAAAGMFAVELGVPFLLFLPRRPRILAAFIIAGFQLLIDFSGNYGFFGWQTVALCILCLDDEFLARLFARPRLLGAQRKAAGRIGRLPPWRRAVAAVVFAVVLAVTLFKVEWLAETLEPLHSLNSYGVFAVMTTERDEIVIEGSDDGASWKPYEFRWKPGDLSRAPAFVEPHMPRLDWQMWFASLDPQSSAQGWVGQLLARLSEGSPPVLRLLGSNPFPEKPPRYLRAQFYQYRFTDSATRSSTGNWWTRSLKGDLVPSFETALLRDAAR
jgi:predicted DCC family thiol-disulfide oxidoreductase YuxK